jgi:DNA-binding PadR family transcriptional regulator
LERGFGGGRLFDAGDLKLVILKLLTEQPSYGYQLIKTMEERLSGGYTPSAGVIYPTLTLLEEEGLASVSNSADNKKVYTVTAAGLEYLKENKERIEELFARLEEAGKGFERGRSPEIMRAFMNLRGAVMARVSREVTAEQIKKITEAINGAAKAIDEL